ncbi:MAG TPA: hypothetical protein EYG73_06630 [Arcobacter sp.]|nr:hypothetical protein [Arcobacter sp.]
MFSPSLFIIMLLLFYLFIPTFEFDEHLIQLQEIFLYMISFVYFLKNTHIKLTKLAKYYLYFAGMFLISILFSCLFSGTAVVGYDIFIFRMFAQSIIAILIYNVLFKKIINVHSLEILLFKSYIILTLPALIGILSMIYGTDILYSIYKPAFGFLGEETFTGFRTASIFKDFFTAGVYYIFVCAFGFYVYFETSVSIKQRFFLSLLILLNYSVLFFTARTGLVLLPLFLIVWITLNKKVSLTFIKKSFPFIFVIISACIYIYIYIYLPNIEAFEWATEVFKLMDQEKVESFGSYTDMARMNMNFIDYLFKNPSLFFFPHHVYDLSYTTSNIYTDNFYLQELYRYGLYGLVSLFVFSLLSILYFRRISNFLVSMILILLILNYKGGPSLFMFKNIYIYMFIFTAIITHVQLKNREREGNKYVKTNHCNF